MEQSEIEAEGQYLIDNYGCRDGDAEESINVSKELATTISDRINLFTRRIFDKRSIAPEGNPLSDYINEVCSGVNPTHSIETAIR
jgi:hypothetical protein